MKYKDQWVEVFKNNLRESDINVSDYTDDEILDIAKGFVAEVIKVPYQWQFELRWYSMLMVSPEKLLKNTNIDLSLFKNRVDKNTN